MRKNRIGFTFICLQSLSALVFVSGCGRDFGSVESDLARYLEFERSVQGRYKTAYESVKFEVVVTIEKSRGQPATNTFGVEYVTCDIAKRGARYTRHDASLEGNSGQVVSQTVSAWRGKPGPMIWFYNESYIARIRLQENDHFELQDLVDYNLSDLEYRYYMRHLDFYPPVSQWISAGIAQIQSFGLDFLEGVEVYRLELLKSAPEGGMLVARFYFDAAHGACLAFEYDFPPSSERKVTHQHRLFYQFNGQGPPIPVSRVFEIDDLPRYRCQQVHTYENVDFSPRIDPDIFFLQYYGLPEYQAKGIGLKRPIAIGLLIMGALMVFLYSRSRGIST